MNKLLEVVTTLLRFLILISCFCGAFFVLFGMKGIVALVLFSIGAAATTDDEGNGFLV